MEAMPVAVSFCTAQMCRSRGRCRRRHGAAQRNRRRAVGASVRISRPKSCAILPQDSEKWPVSIISSVSPGKMLTSAASGGMAGASVEEDLVLRLEDAHQPGDDAVIDGEEGGVVEVDADMLTAFRINPGCWSGRDWRRTGGARGRACRWTSVRFPLLRLSAPVRAPSIRPASVSECMRFSIRRCMIGMDCV